MRGLAFRTRRPPETQIDPTRVKRAERPELLGDDERSVVRQHDAARAHSYDGGARSDVGDGDGRRRAGDARHVVVLGQPEASVPPPLDMTRQIEGVAQGLASVASLDDGREIEN